jgi:hypothetical protein
LMTLRIVPCRHSKVKFRNTLVDIYLHSTDRPILWVSIERWTQRWTNARNICTRTRDNHLVRGHIIVTMQFLSTPACISTYKQSRYETLIVRPTSPLSYRLRTLAAILRMLRLLSGYAWYIRRFGSWHCLS